jgi:hypothetical protein
MQLSPNRGSTVCENSRRVRVSEIDERALGAIEQIALTPTAVGYLVDRVVEHVRTAQRTAPDRAQEIESELRHLQRELDRFIVLIAGGKAPERVLEEITSRETRAKELEVELTQLRAAKPTKLDVARIREFALARAKDVHSALQADVAQVRSVLRQLLVGPITFRLNESGYRLEGETRVGPLFESDPSATRIRGASPRGFEPLLPP